MTMSLPMEDGTTVPMSMDYDYDMTMTVNATGKSVKISFPDFSSFEEIDPRPNWQPEQLKKAAALKISARRFFWQA